MPSQDDTPDSTYAPLQPPPEFKSQIPEYLLADASPQDKHIMAELSIGAQCNRWLVNALVETHAQVRRTNGRLLRAEGDIKDLKGDTNTVKVGWKLVAKVTGMVVVAVTLLATVYQALRSG